MTLIERICRGEAAISRAKVEGRDVTAWEAHLAELKRQAKVAATPQQYPVVGLQTILAEHGADDVGKIMDVWRRLFGVSESRERIAAHLEKLNHWANQRVRRVRQ
jgi:hypothetical protein